MQSGIPGVRNISDDIYIGGIDEAQHDDRLISLTAVERKPADGERSEMLDPCPEYAILWACLQWRRSVTRSQEGRGTEKCKRSKQCE